MRERETGLNRAGKMLAGFGVVSTLLFFADTFVPGRLHSVLVATVFLILAMIAALLTILSVIFHRGPLVQPQTADEQTSRRILSMIASLPNGGDLIAEIAKRASTTVNKVELVARANGISSAHGRLQVVSIGQAVEHDTAMPIGVLQTYRQGSSTQWVIHHGWGRHPTVRILDSEGHEVVADVTHRDDNTVVVGFGQPQQGLVIRRQGGGVAEVEILLGR